MYVHIVECRLYYMQNQRRHLPSPEIAIDRRDCGFFLFQRCYALVISDVTDQYLARVPSAHCPCNSC